MENNQTNTVAVEAGTVNLGPSPLIATDTSEQDKLNISFKPFAEAVEFNYIEIALRGKEPLFETLVDDEDIIAAYLSGFPEDQVQEYTCNCCFDFLRKIGKAVIVNMDGTVTSALWTNLENIDPFFHPSVLAMKEVVEKRAVGKMFYHKYDSVGHIEKGDFNHFHIDLTVKTTNNHNQLAKSGQQYFDLTEKMLIELQESLVQRAVNLFTHDIRLAARKSKGEKIFSNLLNLKQRYSGIKNNLHKTNFIWGIVGSFDFNLINFYNTVQGEFLTNLDKPNYEAQAINLYCAMTAPDAYMRPTALPSEGAIQRAEKIFADLGLESATKRRICGLDDILKFEWKPKPVIDKKADETKTGVFASVKSKQDMLEMDAVPDGIHAGVITMMQFVKTVLPDAESVKFFVPNRIVRIGGFATAVDPEAKPIIRWDSEDAEVRNRVNNFCAIEGDHSSMWGVTSGKYHDVVGICLDPSEWFGVDDRYKDMYSFLVATDAPVQRTFSSCLFPEVLRSELFEVRQVIEEFSNKTDLTLIDNPVIAFTAGPGSVSIDWKVSAMVNGAQVFYTIDRFI